MITLMQAKQLRHRDEVHHGVCRYYTSKRLSKSYFIERWRVNGAMKVWGNGSWCIPIKYGLWGFGYLTDRNASSFHLACECKPTK